VLSEDEQLRNVTRWRRTAAQRRRAGKLGCLVEEYVEHLDDNTSVVDAWSRVVPAKLREHCRLAGISGGQLKVLVDSPIYLYRMRSCGSELLRQLVQQCRQGRIKKIKFVIGR